MNRDPMTSEIVYRHVQDRSRTITWRIAPQHIQTTENYDLGMLFHLIISAWLPFVVPSHLGLVGLGYFRWYYWSVMLPHAWEQSDHQTESEIQWFGIIGNPACNRNNNPVPRLSDSCQWQWSTSNRKDDWYMIQRIKTKTLFSECIDYLLPVHTDECFCTGGSFDLKCYWLECHCFQQWIPL